MKISIYVLIFSFFIILLQNIEVIFQQKARNQDINTSFDQNFKKGDFLP